MPVITESRAPTVDEIVAHLTEAVHEHRLSPGTKLREDELCEIFGVSRTLVRQALRSMEYGGLLTIEKNPSAEDIKRLDQHIREEHAALDREEAGLALKLSGDFHIEIARIADQQTIEQFLRQLISRSSLVIALYWRRRNALCESNAHHALVDSLRNGDGDKAEELMKGHLLDLLSQLDLRERSEGPSSLKDALKR